MPAEKAGVRPAWWKGIDGSVPIVPEIMPKQNSKTRHSFSGKEMEEMIWNRFHNKEWVGKTADLFVGGGHCAAKTRMQVWDHHKRIWKGSNRYQLTQFRVSPSHRLWWKRYHDFLDQGGDAEPHPLIVERFGPWRPDERGAITAMCGVVRVTQRVAGEAGPTRVHSRVALCVTSSS